MAENGHPAMIFMPRYGPALQALQSMAKTGYQQAIEALEFLAKAEDGDQQALKTLQSLALVGYQHATQAKNGNQDALQALPSMALAGYQQALNALEFMAAERKQQGGEEREMPQVRRQRERAQQMLKPATKVGCQVLQALHFTIECGNQHVLPAMLSMAAAGHQQVLQALESIAADDGNQQALETRGTVAENGGYEVMAPLWHHGTTARRAPKKNKKQNGGKCKKANLSFEGVLRA